MRKAGMLTTMRVSVGTAFGPTSIFGSSSVFGAPSVDAAWPGEGVTDGAVFGVACWLCALLPVHADNIRAKPMTSTIFVGDFIMTIRRPVVKFLQRVIHSLRRY